MTFGAWLAFVKEYETLLLDMHRDKCNVRSEHNLGVLVCYCDNNAPHNCKLTDLQSRCHFVPAEGESYEYNSYWISFDGNAATYIADMSWNHPTSSLEIGGKSLPLKIASKKEAHVAVLKKLNDVLKNGALTPAECLLVQMQHAVRKRCEELIGPKQ